MGGVGLQAGELDGAEDRAALVDVAVGHRRVLGAGPAEPGEALPRLGAARNGEGAGRRGGGGAPLGSLLGQRRAPGERAGGKAEDGEASRHACDCRPFMVNKALISRAFPRGFGPGFSRNRNRP